VGFPPPEGLPVLGEFPVLVGVPAIIARLPLLTVSIETLVPSCFLVLAGSKETVIWLGPIFAAVLKLFYQVDDILFVN